MTIASFHANNNTAHVISKMPKSEDVWFNFLKLPIYVCVIDNRWIIIVGTPSSFVLLEKIGEWKIFNSIASSEHLGQVKVPNYVEPQISRKISVEYLSFSSSIGYHLPGSMKDKLPINFIYFWLYAIIRGWKDFCCQFWWNFWYCWEWNKGEEWVISSLPRIFLLNRSHS